VEKLIKRKFRDLSGKKFLIAGAAGFIPSHISEFYLSLGAEVWGVDNFITGSKSNIKRIQDLENSNNVHFEEMDISGQMLENSAIFDVKFDYILSLASPASPIDFKIIPLEIMDVNSNGTKNLLNLAKKCSARFLEASTSECYGDPLVHPQTEEYFGNVNSIGPRSCYDESKRFAEALTMSFHRKYKIDTRIVRIFNTYGPGMRPNDGRVIPNFVNQALEGTDITVYGDGSQTRSFCYITDLIDAMDDVLFSDINTPVNIGNPAEISILECAQIIKKKLSSSSKIIFKELPKDDPRRRRPDISKLSEIAGFQPRIKFEDGLFETAQYFKDIKEKKGCLKDIPA